MPMEVFLLIKLMGVLAVTGFTIELEKETKIIRRLIKMTKLNLKLVKGFPLPNGHVVVIGRTQNGKTFATMHTLTQTKDGVFFFNAQLVSTPNGFIKVNGDYSTEQIISLLKKGKKLNYLPSTDIKKMGKELVTITNSFYDYGEINMRYVIDEVHLFQMLGEKDALNACKRVATTGIRFGYKGVFLSQRPAMVDNTLYTQAIQNVIFNLGKNDVGYMKNLGFPVEEIMNKIDNTPYVFVTYDDKEINGPFKIKP